MYNGEHVEDGLVGWWPMNKGVGDNIFDKSGNNNHGQIKNETFWFSPPSAGLVFDGSDDYVSTSIQPSDIGIEGNKSKTISAWAKIYNFDEGGLWEMGTTSDYEEFSLRTRTGTNEFRAQLYGGGDIDFTYDALGKWVHFALVHDSSSDTTKVYCNGEQVASQSQTINTTDGTPFRIGEWADAYLDGAMDDVRIYDKALSQEQITDLLEGERLDLKPVGWWPLTEGEGKTAYDHSGGEAGTLRFDGSDDYVETPADAGDLGIAGNNPKTVSAWAYTTDFDDDGAIFSFGSPGTDGEDFALRTRGGQDEWRGQFWGGYDIDFTYPSYEQWVHFTIVHTGSETIIYTDGTEEASQSQSLDTSTAEPFRMGWWPERSSSNTFHGMIKDVRVYDTALTSTEVNNLYNGTYSGTGPVAHWPMDEGSGVIVYDNTANGYDGSIYGASWIGGNNHGDINGAIWFGGEIFQITPADINAGEMKTWRLEYEVPNEYIDEAGSYYVKSKVSGRSASGNSLEIFNTDHYMGYPSGTHETGWKNMEDNANLAELEASARITSGSSIKTKVQTSDNGQTIKEETKWKDLKR